MTVDRYKIKLSEINDKFINIPINIDFDLSGRDDAIDEYEKQVVKEIIGEAEDFEIYKFAHAPDTIDDTKLLHDFYFLNQTNNTYQTDYRAIDAISNPPYFTDEELYYYVNSFTNCFFKLDFYDSPDSEKQINYLTQIIPVQQGKFIEGTINKKTINPQKVKLRSPSFSLDYVGDKEGFFIYWLRKKTFLNIDTFYVSAKFFDAKSGQFIRLLNTNPLTPALPKNFDQRKYFYYKYVLDYQTLTYKVYRTDVTPEVRVGIGTTPINWFEYINPI
jgi:hypothetical protein